jgi:superfamily I DNA/RNA helicase
MTYHSSKGLDYDAVFLPKIDSGILAASNPDALALVALSRSKRDLIITFTDEMSYTFKKFLKNVKVKSINQYNNDILF